ncbi:Ger(x)C family spore germination C-terminal domain-containing protein [Paenibacillus allorhizosphaerae]|uniref:Spore germination GerAC-like C-terminal domain-containing protein n=1 Tax=Paenibacillus allorhizosphaerae TaxID=2849866 RepID=A0ABM8VL52_9BACL|nr:Ger(x)C family spore germination C-terminal domain-containing protein [Paenibacillus allorhizosphaerae]CAG7647921.1 hypothetical protein PAECIP111802_04097 [Paenibacillus allorhizosphaerae]
MDRQLGLIRRRQTSVLMVLTASMLLAGCASSGSGSPRAMVEERGSITVVGVDTGAGGMKMTAAEMLPAGSQDRLQAYGTPIVRTQSFVSLADAVWQWERKGAPQLVVIGEEWVRMHGFASSWANQIARLGFKDGRRPLVAVTEGAAEHIVRSSTAARSSAALLRQADWTANPLRARSVSYEEDLVLPYLTRTQEHDRAEKVSVQAVLFKKGQLAGMLSPQQSGMLSCLRGAANLPELSWPMPEADNGAAMLERVSCRSEVRGNGSLTGPVLTVDVAVQGESAAFGSASAAQAESAARALLAAMTALVRDLQERRIDPLHAGDSFRQQYAGVWSPDRWRESFAKAEVRLSVKLNLIGGTNP